MFKGMTPVPVILRMIYVNTRIEDFFHHFSRPIKSKTKTNRELLTLVFPRKEPATIALQFDRFMWLSACFFYCQCNYVYFGFGSDVQRE